VAPKRSTLAYANEHRHGNFTRRCSSRHCQMPGTVRSQGGQEEVPLQEQADEPGWSIIDLR